MNKLLARVQGTGQLDCLTKQRGIHIIHVLALSFVIVSPNKLPHYLETSMHCCISDDLGMFRKYIHLFSEDAVSYTINNPLFR